MTVKRMTTFYFFLVLAGVLVLAGMRSSPVYGKLDFILLDGRPWWKSWKPMIEQILQQGNQPVLTDSMTSTVLRAVFVQNTVAFRFNYRFSHIDVEELLRMNTPPRKMLPVGALSVLLEDQSRPARSVGGFEKNKRNISIHQLMAKVAKDMAQKESGKGQSYPYRCIINLHGFTPSWVSAETRHWPQWFAYTSAMYRYRGMRGQDLERMLNKHPPENCMVFF